MRDVRERLSDVLEAIENIQRRTPRERKAFDEDELLQVWFLRHFQIIGEACRNLPQEFRDKHDEVPWAKIAGMRNILVHHYFEIDTDIVWTAAREDLPELKAKMQRILEELD